MYGGDQPEVVVHLWHQTLPTAFVMPVGSHQQ
jgi:hypothetical protein